MGGGKLKDDLLHYKKRKGLNGNNLFCLVYLLLKFKEFRNIFYWRVGMWSKYIILVAGTEHASHLDKIL